ncbi:DNA phosphorothioation system sulfurtransferase DndC [Emticicia soli]|uniref:DNA phosphorothioation system sulfurtransferase DndC n=1 Tax=Emticicia soli TaxID=2027878 RepID=A0ABW5JFL9_9BACT
MALDTKEIEKEIQEQYMEDDNYRPWIVGFSGGKDSTMLLQLVWTAIASLPEIYYKRHIYVVCNNTLVENPKIVEYTDKILLKIEKAALVQNIPLTIHKTIPRLEDTFWVNLLGKGYPAPNNLFRWCTERLKISPTTKFIVNKINEEGEAIILLGTRSDESSTRAKSIKKHEVKGRRLSKHMTLPNAHVYSPIKNVLIKDLWTYLQQVPSPWGANNKELVTLYQNANSGDCPLVIDTSTSSCGNSRFGCWVCTVVNRDKSLEALVANGEEWMIPLMELRDYLVNTRDLESVREVRRRNGQQIEGVLGPYKPHFRAEFLEKLLVAQREIQAEQSDISLINYQELVAIQVTWYRDNIFSFNVADIYNRVNGTNIEIETNDKVLEEKTLLKEICKENPKDFELLNDLLALQKTRTILMNNRGLQTDLENKLENHIQNHL